MAEIALPRQQVTQAAQSAGVGSPLYQCRRASNTGTIELIPNPEFSFPQRASDASSTLSTPAPNARPMSMQMYPSNRRGSTPGLRQKSVSALPDFSFNPAATPPLPASGTPPHSPAVTPTTPSRPVGHRRGGSELIGGDGRTGGVTLLSTSPTKDVEIVPPPNVSLRPGPPAGRSRHAHRRSGAISSHDLSAMMRPADPIPHPHAGSAPVTPLEGDQFAFAHKVNKSMSQPSLRETSPFPENGNSSPPRPLSRARVGFADRVEYIRPLSTISSETETSTVRGHSTTNSLSSIVSGTTTPPSARMSRPSLNTSIEVDERPSTAGAILDMSPRTAAHIGGDVFNRKRPMSAISPASPSTVTSPTFRVPTKRRGFFRLEPRRSEPSVTSLATSASDPMLSATVESPLPSPMIEDEEIPDASENNKNASCKSNRRPRKVKSWANSIILRKGKSGGKSKSRPHTPPPAVVTDLEDESSSEDLDFEANFDEDNTVTIVSPKDSSVSERKAQTDIASWKPRELKRVDSDVMSPVIDLDAALGPFNTPQGSNSQGTQRGFGAHRRAMHSAGGLAQNHRRTESAPELVPFELRGAVVAKPLAMADVFEEEEPEEEMTTPSTGPVSPTKDQEEMDEFIDSPKIQLVEADDNQTGSTINWNFQDGLRIKRGSMTRDMQGTEPISPHQIPRPVTSHSPDVGSVEVVEDYEEPRTSSLTQSSDSTVTPQISADDKQDGPAMMKLPLPLPQQTMRTPDTYTSSFSSPDFRSSQTSFDTPRLGTAASSITDYRAMSSPNFGEPGPEMRVSVDDVPSLTSSRSTMTSAMQGGFPIPRVPGERATSLSSTLSDVETRRRKRSSIASLSRLINGSSHGEKSKLSIEQRPQSEHSEPSKDSKKKHKRLSKLMFWKPKDPQSS